MADRSDVEGRPDHWQSYPRFLLRCLMVALDGGRIYMVWMGSLFVLAMIGLHAFGVQTEQGMGATNMSDHVSWGIYIANLTYFVGLAAGGVMMVIPAYLYKDHEMHKVVLAGEFLAVASIVVALGFVVVDIGRPDRFWHILPFIGRFNWPMSMLTWDVIVLAGYFLLNLHICGYLLYTRFLGIRPARRFYLPVVLISIVWAISIHTVTAFLYSGLGGRPFWNTAILAPRFIASAFVTGPAFIVLTLQIVRTYTDFEMKDGPLRTLVAIMRVTVLLNLFLLLSEVFTVFYSGGTHSAGAIYLYFGLPGHRALVPWIWSAIALNVTSAGLLVFSGVGRNLWRVNLACVLALAGVWIEKGMGLVVPGFVPSTLHEVVEYTPNFLEWKITVGLWALGLMVYTVGAKLSVAVYTGEEALRPRKPKPRPLITDSVVGGEPKATPVRNPENEESST